MSQNHTHTENISHTQTSPPVYMKEWLLMQAHLQLDYAGVDNAITILEFVEETYGESITTGLMLCKAWSQINEAVKLEVRARKMLNNIELSNQQRAAIYFCLSQVRWVSGNKNAARKAYLSYNLHIKEQSDLK
ncbi:hypothetical protein TDB9533_04602 [Thalassocella blandensis]|nr:hypothetical protein TDB9533_04602 [Thalassocella blandensis]